jgi:poly-beta-1,6-N-acetyl-D-glucosamine synthase
MIVAVVVPFLDEERELGRLLESLARQTRRPDRVVLVDDGSTDGSRAVAERFADGRPEVTVLARPPRPPQRDRLAAGGELLAFESAVAGLDEPWDVVGKLDADIRLTPRTIETIERALREDPGLGIVGTPLAEQRPDGTLARMPSRPEHVHGATSFYRRACFEQIMPLPAIAGWDMIDTPRARMAGWRTATVEIPDGDPLHLRPMGSRDGLLRAFRRWGRGAYTVGEHPLHVALLTVRRLREPPVVLGALNYLAGWAHAALTRAPRAEPELRDYVRADQLRRVRARLPRARSAAHEPRG